MIVGKHCDKNDSVHNETSWDWMLMTALIQKESETEVSHDTVTASEFQSEFPEYWQITFSIMETKYSGIIMSDNAILEKKNSSLIINLLTKKLRLSA